MLGNTPADPCQLAQPPFELVTINEAGLVLHAPRPYELGQTMALGVHLVKAIEAAGTHCSNIEGVVVECKLIGPHPYGYLYQVTIVFPQLLHHETGLIQEASRLKTKSPEPRRKSHTWFCPRVNLAQFTGLN